MSLESHIYYNLSGLRISEGEWRMLTSVPSNVVLAHSHMFGVCVVSRWTGVDARPLYPDLPAAYPLIFDLGVVIRGKLRVQGRYDDAGRTLRAHRRQVWRHIVGRGVALIVLVAIASYVMGLIVRGVLGIGDPLAMLPQLALGMGIRFDPRGMND